MKSELGSLADDMKEGPSNVIMHFVILGYDNSLRAYNSKCGEKWLITVIIYLAYNE